MPWTPTTIQRWEDARGTSTGVALVVTDEGHAFLKSSCSDEGPHAVAREWVVSSLAKDFGLPVPEFALIEIKADDEVFIYTGAKQRKARPGWAFVSRRIAGATQWGGSADELKHLANPDAVARLVVFDTWVRNADRYGEGMANYGNVMLRTEKAKRGTKSWLIALDHTHCCPCPKPGSELKTTISGISNIRNDTVYGLFPAFVSWVREVDVDKALDDLRRVDASRIAQIIDTVPRDWDVSAAVREAWAQFFVDRAAYVADNLKCLLRPKCWPGTIIDNRTGTEEKP